MKRTLTAMLLAAMLMSTAALAEVPDYFLTDYDQAQAKAQELDKPLFIHFTTTWCGWCRRIEDDIYKKPAGKEALSNFVAVSLDCTVPEGQEPDAETRKYLGMLREYGGQGYPHLAMTTADGILLHSFAGYKPMKPFTAELKTAQAKWGQYREFQEYAAQADKESYEYNLRAMVFYNNLNAGQKAVKAAEKIIELDPENKKGGLGQAKLVLLTARPASGGGEATHELFEEIRRLDPVNADGVYEQAAARQAYRYLMTAAQSGADEQKRALQSGISVLEGLFDQAESVKSAQNLYGMLGYMHFRGENFQAALAANEKALAADPQSEAAPRIRGLIANLRNKIEEDSAATKPAE